MLDYTTFLLLKCGGVVANICNIYRCLIKYPCDVKFFFFYIEIANDDAVDLMVGSHCHWWTVNNFIQNSGSSWSHSHMPTPEDEDSHLIEKWACNYTLPPKCRNCFARNRRSVGAPMLDIRLNRLAISPDKKLLCWLKSDMTVYKRHKLIT